MRREIVSILCALALALLLVLAGGCGGGSNELGPGIRTLTEDSTIFADDFGSGSDIRDVTTWDIPSYTDWDVDSDTTGRDAALRIDCSTRYLRLRSGRYIQKNSISTAGLTNIHLEYTWGQDTDNDSSDDGDLVVLWKLSSASTWTEVNRHDLASNTQECPNAHSMDIALGSSAADTTIDIRFWGDTDERRDEAWVDNIIISGDTACTTYYRDDDDDGYGQTEDSQCLTTPSDPYDTTVDGDCDDTDANEHPGQTWYKDADDDGYSDGTTDTSSCTRPTGYKVASELTATSGDCDDTDASVNPEATEVPYNGKDDDCNPATLDDDLDQDTYGIATDCDDNDASVNPGATEVPYNGKDDDCNPATLDDDLDQDTYGIATDCDDNDTNVNPGAAETWYDGVDQDCDGANDYDADGDTYVATGYDAFAGGTAPNTDDCDDTDANVNPGATEVPYNGKNDDCNPATLDDDLDQDTYGIATDCDDNDANVNPGAAETWYDGVDQDCDGANDYDADSDTYVATGYDAFAGGTAPNTDDCDDTDANVNPGVTEVPYNGKDDDCNPATPDAVYDLIMAADPEVGGTATDLTGESPYTEGAEVSIKAEANEGYEFVNWTAPAGGFDDASAAETTFTMPAEAVTVTANFEEVPPLPEDPTVTTQAATDVSTGSATLNMNYTMGNHTSVEVRFAYKKSNDSAWSYTDWVTKTADGTHAESLTELNSNTEYEFTAQLRGSASVEGTTLQFSTDKPSTPSPSEGGLPPPSGGCFIATAAYGTPTAEQIDVLREFRDVVLLESTAGSQFVALYYQFSPPVADFISGSNFLRTLVRELLVDPIVRVVEATEDIWQN